jgi:transcriptional regulator with XRE-family HTH domain
MSMSEQNPTSPYKSLGLQLLQLRQKLRESAAEVSGAVEIDLEMLERIENGMELPSEDILLLLINHFNVHDDEAVKLWELAGYDQRDHADRGTIPMMDEHHLSKQPVVMLLGMDARVVYTNGVDVAADPSGVVMNFTQYTDPTQQSLAVARVGMSHEQAQKVLESLQQALLRSKYSAGPKALPAPQATQKHSRKSKKQGE